MCLHKTLSACLAPMLVLLALLGIIVSMKETAAGKRLMKKARRVGKKLEEAAMEAVN